MKLSRARAFDVELRKLRARGEMGLALSSEALEYKQQQLSAFEPAPQNNELVSGVSRQDGAHFLGTQFSARQTGVEMGTPAAGILTQY